MWFWEGGLLPTKRVFPVWLREKGLFWVFPLEGDGGEGGEEGREPREGRKESEEPGWEKKQGRE